MGCSCRHPMRMRSGALSGFNILVVDDEPLLRRHLAATLEGMGADVSQADSPAGNPTIGVGTGLRLRAS